MELLERLKNSLFLKIAASFVGLFVIIFSGMLFENVDADEIVVIQSPAAGRLSCWITPGIKWQGLGKTTIYHKLETYEFQIPVRFNDGGHGTIHGSVNYELPLDTENLISLHVRYGSQESIQKELLETVVNKSVYMTGPLMSSKESYAERRTSLILYIEDQIKNGVYATAQKDVKVKDPITGVEKTATVVEIRLDTQGIPMRQEESVLSNYHIKTSNFAVTRLPYDDAVENQIKQQQELAMKVQTAMASAKEAEQRAITVAKEGEANAAKAKWEQEVEKAKAVTLAQQQFEVSKLEALSAEQKKRAEILLGEGEATRKKLVMAADGALEKKLDAWKSVNQMYADAMQKYPGAWVPQIVMGESSTGRAGSGAQAMIDLLTTKTALQLGLETKIEKK